MKFNFGVNLKPTTKLGHHLFWAHLRQSMQAFDRNDLFMGHPTQSRHD